MGLSIVGISIPVFLTAILSIYIFSVELGWLPSFGRGETVNFYGWTVGFLTRDGLLHLILPCVALSSIMLPLFIRLIRGEMMEVLESDYIRFAWAKGLSPPSNLVFACFEEHAFTSHHCRRIANRNAHRLYHID